LQSRPAFSWIVFGWPDGTFFGAHKLGDEQLEMTEIENVDGVLTRRIDRYRVLAGDIEFEARSFEPTGYVVTDQPWYRVGNEREVPRWINVSMHPNGLQQAIGYAGPIDVYQRRQGVLAIVIEYARLSRFLAQLAVGKSGTAFILGSNGTTVAVPDANADETRPPRMDEQPLLALAHRIAATLGPELAAYPPVAHESRQVFAGTPYALTLTPLGFTGWTLATVVPESEFLGEVEMATRRLLVGLVGLVLVAGLLSAWLARRTLAGPLVKVAESLGHVQRFELDKVRAEPSHITEVERLSGAIADMANGPATNSRWRPALS
jgi:adenylate cyclase